MPAVFGFALKDTAERLLKLSTAPTITIELEEADDAIGWVLRTPAEGIPGHPDPTTQSETTEVPSALCETWTLIESGGKVYRRKVLDSQGNHLLVLASNMDADPIPPDTFIRASRVVGGAFLTDYAPCD